MTQVNVIVGNENYVEEVNSAKEQAIVEAIRTETEYAQRILMQTAINIGKRLVEAKSFVKHGQWENWLKERVNFSQRTANNFMKVYNEYGHSLESQTISSLNYSQAVELLAIPADEREKFAKEINAKDMTIKALRETIKESKSEQASAQAEIKRLKIEQENISKQKADLEKETELLSTRIEELRQREIQAKENQDKELKKRLAESIKSEQNKMDSLEKEKASLLAQMEKLEKSHENAISKIREEEQQKAEKQLVKKSQEMERATKRFRTEIDKIKEDNRLQKDKVKDAENRAALSKELIKCEVLLGNIERDYEELKVILKRIQRKYPENVIGIENALADVLKSMEKRSKLHAV